jgi:hypothetical protein
MYIFDQHLYQVEGTVGFQKLTQLVLHGVQSISRQAHLIIQGFGMYSLLLQLPIHFLRLIFNMLGN